MFVAFLSSCILVLIELLLLLILLLVLRVRIVLVANVLLWMVVHSWVVHLLLSKDWIRLFVLFVLRHHRLLISHSWQLVGVIDRLCDCDFIYLLNFFI